MKYLVTFQDRILKLTVDAQNKSKAAVKAQKLVKDLYVISVDLIPDK